MTPEQKVQELRKALAMDERLRNLLLDCAKDYADAALRLQYRSIEPSPSLLVRHLGLAEGVEKFTADITKSPQTAPRDRNPPLADKKD